MYEQEILTIQNQIAELQKKLELPDSDVTAIKKQIAELENKIFYLQTKEVEYEARVAYEKAKQDWEIARKNLEEAAKTGGEVAGSYKRIIEDAHETAKNYRTFNALILGAGAFWVLASYAKKKR